MIASWPDPVVTSLRRWWHRHGSTLMVIAVACMVTAAVWRLSNELPRLLFAADGAFDLQLRHREVHRWFAGLEVYGDPERGDYPPASYVLLWPLLGWLALEPARWLWALTTIAALAWMGALNVREAGASGRAQVLLLALLPFSVYASSATIAMGQIINHTIPALLAGLLLLRREPRWRTDLLAAALLLAVLVKPTLTAPFFWLVCFVPGRLRPIVLVSTGYIAFSLFAVSFQDGPLTHTLLGWLGETPQVRQGHTNIHKWLALAGLRAWMLPASALIMAALAWWVHRHRHVDYWVLIGVSALVAQFFLHHRLYDHLLVMIPMVTLFRLARSAPTRDGSDVTAGVLFGLIWLTLHAPASILATRSAASILMETGQAAVWFAALLFLLDRARRERLDRDTVLRSVTLQPVRAVR
jgi:hypothetical protein